MSNRIALYRKTLRELYKELHELEDTLEYLESRKRPSYRKIYEAEDNIEDCQDDIDTVRRMLNRLLKRQKAPAPKKPTPKKKVTKPFQAPPQKTVARKPVSRPTSIPKHVDDEGYLDDEEERAYYAETFGEEALDDLEEMLADFPELDEYIDDDIFEMDDEDFYGGTEQ